MFFLFLILVIWGLYCFLLKKKTGDHFKISQALLPLVLFCFLLTLDLGINYIAGAVPALNDGIGLHSKFAFYILGDDGWSLEQFKSAYDTSFVISLILLLTYAGSALLQTSKRKA